MKYNNDYRVRINSSQTLRTEGTMIDYIDDRVWGRQFLIRTNSQIWGYEFFWMRENEIQF